MKLYILPIGVLLALAGCSTSTDYDPYVAALDNQLETRNYQTRKLENIEYTSLVSAVIGTLLDYHFRIVSIDPDLGTITAYQMTTYKNNTGLGGKTDLSVLIRERGEKTYSVRMNMSTGLKVDNKPELYQQFFKALHKRLHYESRA
jgi:hypothetical protein